MTCPCPQRGHLPTARGQTCPESSSKQDNSLHSRKLLKHCSQCSGKELPLLSSPPCSGQCAESQDYPGAQGRLVAHREAPVGAAVPQQEPGHCLGGGRTQGMLCLSRTMDTAEAPPQTAHPAHLSQEKPGLWSMPGWAGARTMDQASLACANQYS